MADAHSRGLNLGAVKALRVSPGFESYSAQKVQSLVQPELDRLGLSWEDDVEDVYPVMLPAMKLFIKAFPNPHRQVLISSTPDPEKLLDSLKLSLRTWPIFRSIAIESEEGPPLLVVLRCSEQYLNQAISAVVEVKDNHALMNIRMPGNHAKGQTPRGLMFRAVVAKIVESETSALVVLLNHAIMDGYVLISWRKEVAARLTLRTVPPKVPYKLFSDIYRLYSGSVPAQEAVTSHLKRLRGIGALREALWPPSNMTGSTLGQVPQAQSSSPNNESKQIDEGTMQDKKPGDEAVEGSQNNNVQHTKVRKYPTLPKLRSEFGIHASIVAKAAVVIFNCIQTGQNCAIMAQLLSGRAWPYLHDSLEKLLPNPRGIAGPTLSTAVDLVVIDWKESVVDMLRRLDMEQHQLGSHQHVPLANLLTQMTTQDRAVWQAALRQHFNWQPFGSKPYSTGVPPGHSPPVDSGLRLVSDIGYKVDQPMEGCTWECGLVDDEHLTFHIKINPRLFSEVEVATITSSVMNIVEFLCDVGNWEKEVREVRSAFNFELISRDQNRDVTSQLRRMSKI